MQNEMWQQQWPAPAKINRFLHIIGRRDDGYHLLQSIFQFVDFCDYLIFSPEKSDKISIENSIDNLADDDNLVVKAAKLLQNTCSSKPGVNIQLEKNIPMGAGLGGGSSDAATTLLVLNQLWNCGLSINELALLGERLGADVPFFVHGHNAFVEGIGEKISPVQIDLPKILLAIPKCHITTAEVFSEANLNRSTAPISLADIVNNCSSENSASKTTPILNLLHFGHNDCQQIVTTNHPEVKFALNWLKPFSQPRLSGTGGCVFSIFSSDKNLSEITATKPVGIQTIITKTLQTSPLHALLAKI